MGIEPSPEIDDVSFGSATGSSCLSERLVVFTNQSKKPAGESRQTTHRTQTISSRLLLWRQY